MKVLVVGGGAREHAIVWKLKQSTNVTDIICAPGNPGIARLATCIDLSEMAVAKLSDLAVVQGVDLTVASSYNCIESGIVDHFQERRLRIFGPTKHAARLCFSPYFAKEFMLKHKIPTSRYAVFAREDLALAYVDSLKTPLVIKSGNSKTHCGVFFADTGDTYKNSQ